MKAEPEGKSRPAASGLEDPGRSAGTPGRPELGELTLRRAKAGEEPACRALFRMYGGRVHAYLFRMLGRRFAEAALEDLTQETFLRVFRSLASFQAGGPARLSTWILTIAHRLALNELRRSPRVEEVGPTGNPALPASPDPAEDASQRELGLRLGRALDALSADQRAVVLLHDYHGLTQEEAAAALGVAPGTIKSRLSRARAGLRRMLELEDE